MNLTRKQACILICLLTMLVIAVAMGVISYISSVDRSMTLISG